MHSLDVARFREVVGHFATGVVVITAATPEGPVGFTCQTFGSLSIDPILISFAARTASTSWPRMRPTGSLAVNILASHQEALARVFATSANDKFDGVAWSPGTSGAPLLGDALATLEGNVVDVVTHGDHDIVVVAVSHVTSRDGLPLLYYRGGFGTFSS